MVASAYFHVQPPETQDAAFERLAKRPPVATWLQGTGVNATALFSSHGLSWSLPVAPAADASQDSVMQPCLAHMLSSNRQSTSKGESLPHACDRSAASASHGVCRPGELVQALLRACECGAAARRH